MPKIVLLVILAVIVAGSIYFWQNKTTTNSQANYINEAWKFSLEIPQGFLVEGTDSPFHVVKEPTLENETPSPEMRIKIEKGSQTAMQSDKDMTVVSSEKITVNGVQGHKTVVSYKDYPAGNQCPIHRLHASGVVYEFSLYECLESEIFETVVQSFKII